MTDLNLFSDQPEIDPNKNYYEELVGPDKKFKDNEALAKKAIYSDAHIAKVEKENQELSQAYLRVMEENKTKAKLEELINKFDQQRTSTAQPEGNDDRQPFDSSQIESLFDKKWNEKETLRRQEQNFSLVKENLINRFGSNYQDAVRQQITDLGITEADFNQMARMHPQLVIKTLGLNQPTNQFQAPIRSTNTGFKPTVKQERTWTWYQEQKKANPKLFRDPNFLIQMDQDSQRLGESFFDD